jgi:uncharacterized tellurite resistance protein B-like protein
MLVAAITMIAADGEVDDAEIGILRRLSDGDDSAFDAAVRFWRTNDMATCIRCAAEGLSIVQRNATLANLVDIAMADGVLDESERVLLNAYAAAFATDDDIINRIVHVIGMKNNHAIFDE